MKQEKRSNPFDDEIKKSCVTLLKNIKSFTTGHKESDSVRLQNRIAKIEGSIQEYIKNTEVSDKAGSTSSSHLNSSLNFEYSSQNQGVNFAGLLQVKPKNNNKEGGGVKDSPSNNIEKTNNQREDNKTSKWNTVSTRSYKEDYYNK